MVLLVVTEAVSSPLVSLTMCNKSLVITSVFMVFTVLYCVASARLLVLFVVINYLCVLLFVRNSNLLMWVAFELVSLLVFLSILCLGAQEGPLARAFFVVVFCLGVFVLCGAVHLTLLAVDVTSMFYGGTLLDSAGGALGFGGASPRGLGTWGSENGNKLFYAVEALADKDQLLSLQQYFDSLALYDDTLRVRRVFKHSMGELPIWDALVGPIRGLHVACRVFNLVHEAHFWCFFHTNKEGVPALLSVGKNVPPFCSQIMGQAQSYFISNPLVGGEHKSLSSVARYFVDTYGGPRGGTPTTL